MIRNREKVLNRVWAEATGIRAIVVHVKTQRDTEGLEDAGHQKTAAADSDPMADRILPAEQLGGKGTPQHADRRGPRRSRPSGRKRPRAIFNWRMEKKEAVVPTNGDLAVPRLPGHRRRPHDNGGHRLDGAATQQGLGVIDGKIPRRLAGERRSAAGGFRPAGQHDQQIGAQGRELIGDITAGAIAKRCQHHHRAHADGHGQQHEKGPQPMAAQGANRKMQGIIDAHFFI